jgi:hypothetical protein
MLVVVWLHMLDRTPHLSDFSSPAVYARAEDRRIVQTEMGERLRLSIKKDMGKVVLTQVFQTFLDL